ncbi:hypothetical protein ABNQ38_17520 [Azospirillum sp. A29]|uniref:hypothetical protein n=1 Tax=Azospirillum sp. A29 TaxID=3160606 RepID=UPI0036716638
MIRMTSMSSIFLLCALLSAVTSIARPPAFPPTDRVQYSPFQGTGTAAPMGSTGAFLFAPPSCPISAATATPNPEED